MLDRDIVAAIVAGDPAGLEAAYDRYAPSLYAYCQSLLTEPADAADTVQDTFIIAAAKLSALRDQDRLRPWLYAVARNECRRRLRSAGRATLLDEAAGVTDDTADLGADLEQAQLREMVWSALAGLTASEREIIELNLGHELDGADLADALGVPRNQAHAMASRARAHFEAALGVLLVARSGRDACPELAGMLEGWDGRLTVLLRKRVGRHIRRCSVCGDRQRRELSPVALLSALPVAALPAALRHQVLGLISDGSPGAVAQRLAVGQRVGPLGPGGFPRPLDPPSPVHLHHLAHGTAYARGGAAVGGAAIVGGALVGGGLLHHPGPAQPPGARPALPSSSAPPVAGSPSAPASGAGGAGDGATSPGPKVLRSGSAGASTKPAAPGGTPAPATTSAAPAPAISAVVAGTLTVSPASLGLKLSLAGLWTGTLTLTAHGGPVSAYHVAVPVPLLQDLTLSQVSGSLAAGQSVRITVTAAGGALFSTALLTVSPGSLSVPVTYNLLG
ncbi:MAG TPA: sigma-70 family RNA polymerase sigma factor [Streptosporangiaceae bacterium]